MGIMLLFSLKNCSYPHPWVKIRQTGTAFQNVSGSDEFEPEAFAYTVKLECLNLLHNSKRKK